MPKRSGLYTVPFEFDLLSFDEAVGLAADTGRISGDAGPLLESVCISMIWLCTQSCSNGVHPHGEVRNPPWHGAIA